MFNIPNHKGNQSYIKDSISPQLDGCCQEIKNSTSAGEDAGSREGVTLIHCG
jgi:hypothetical protein